MRELAKVSLAVAATELILWSVGVWSWVSYALRGWPWLLDRYALILPPVLVIGLLTLRRWRPVRSHFVGAGLGGAAVGLVASEVSRVLAEAVSAQQRAILWNSWRLDSAAEVLLIESLFAFFLTLGWLYGASASILALVADRAERRYLRPREQAGSLAG
jgi:hypothetical protein